MEIFQVSNIILQSLVPKIIVYVYWEPSWSLSNTSVRLDLWWKMAKANLFIINPSIKKQNKYTFILLLAQFPALFFIV